MLKQVSPQTPFRGCERHGTGTARSESERRERGGSRPRKMERARREGEFEWGIKRPPGSKGGVFLPRDRRFGLGV